MGSGTTVGEAYKLGCTAIGRDINPVAYRLVKTALSKISRQRLLDLYSQLQEQVEADLRQLYVSTDRNGAACDVLYYFWVKTLPCPTCQEQVDLFSSYVFARHAYQARFPQIQIVCPDCGQLFSDIHGNGVVTCPCCQLDLTPKQGRCMAPMPLVAVAARPLPWPSAHCQGHPPKHRLYAKLILSGDGEKLPAHHDGGYQR